MPGQLECPMSGTNIDADLLYYSRGEDNSSYRPVLTGDVYENLLLPAQPGRRETAPSSFSSTHARCEPTEWISSGTYSPQR